MHDRARDAFQEGKLASLIESLGLVVMDAGARGGLDRDFLPAAWATKAIGFEPDPEECARLNRTPRRVWREANYLPFAVGKEVGVAKLHVPRNPVGASLYEHNVDMIPRFGHPELHQTRQTMEVQTIAIDDAIAQMNLDSIDYLKIDVEGAELDVLSGARMAISQLSAVKVECSFLRQRRGQPLIWEVAAEMMRRGFICAAVLDVHYWRRRPWPGHPYMSRHTMPYSRGLAAQCDLTFIRDFHFSSAEGLIRLFVVAAILGFFDYAVTIARDMPEVEKRLRREIGGEWVGHLAKISKRVGRGQSRCELRKQARSMWPLFKSAFLAGVDSGEGEMEY